MVAIENVPIEVSKVFKTKTNVEKITYKERQRANNFVEHYK
jgi:hypothetical protein